MNDKLSLVHIKKKKYVSSNLNWLLKKKIFINYKSNNLLYLKLL